MNLAIPEFWDLITVAQTSLLNKLEDKCLRSRPSIEIVIDHVNVALTDLGFSGSQRSPPSRAADSHDIAASLLKLVFFCTVGRFIPLVQRLNRGHLMIQTRMLCCHQFQSQLGSRKVVWASCSGM